MPDRTPADLVYALLVFPAELWLLSRIWSTMVSWLNIWFGARRDGWAAQAAAESGKGGGGDVIGKLVGSVLIGGAAISAGTWWWIEKAGVEIQQQVLAAAVLPASARVRIANRPEPPGSRSVCATRPTGCS